jgi:hypothetical protein
MKLNSIRAGLLLLIAAMISLGAQAQTTPTEPAAPAGYSTFSLTANVMPLSGGGQTTAATDVGEAFAITPNFSVRADQITAPGSNLSAYLGGVKYFLPTSKLLAKTNLNPQTFQFYVTGGAGINRYTPAAAAGSTVTPAVQQHFAAVAGGGVNYDPTSSGNFSLNLIEVRWGHFPGFNNSTALISSGVKLSW